MEKLLIFSDTHGVTSVMSNALKCNQHCATTVIHLGDGTDDAESVMNLYPQIPLVTVRGNREDYYSMFSSAPRETTLDIGGLRIFLCHGHTYNVKSSVNQAIYRAIEQRADILLYGHTHIADYSIVAGIDETHPLHVVNPGSARTCYAEIIIDASKPKINLIRT